MSQPERNEDASASCRRLEARLARAAFRLEMAQLERTWAVVSAHRQGFSIRKIAKHLGLKPTRVHQLISAPEAALAEHALSVLRELGWPAPEDPGDSGSVADRLTGETAVLLRCADWLEVLTIGGDPVVNLRPEEDWPDTDNVLVDAARIVRILRRIAGDMDELARQGRMTETTQESDDAFGRRVRHRRQLGEPPIECPTGPMSVMQARHAWEEYEVRLRRAGLRTTPNPFRHLDRSPK